MTGDPRVFGRRRNWWRLLPAVLTVVVIGLLVACDDDDHSTSIAITNARAQFTTTDLGAVYLDIETTGVGDVLVAASSGIADDTQVHEVVTEGSSAMMRPVQDGIPIDAGGRVSLEPGGYHVMLLGVEEIPEVGSTFELVLEFERAGRVTITVHVQEFGGEDAGRDHGSMDDEEMDGEEADHE